MIKRHYNIPIFIPELACPFQCIFCDQRKITSVKNRLEEQEIINTIESHLASFTSPEAEVQLAFFGGTFTGLNLEEQKYYLNLIQPYIKNKAIQGIRISTRPDYITQENLVILKGYGVTHIELGAQSLVDEVLTASHRGHSVEDVRKASSLILKHNFVLGLQMMIGLPEDTMERSMETAKQIVAFGAKETRIYPTVIIRGTALETLWKKGIYHAIDTETAIEQSAMLYEFFEKNQVKILRVGLYPSDELTKQGEALSGPEMPHFKEKVMGQIWKTNFRNRLDFSKWNEKIQITVSPSEYNFAVGFKASNRKFLERSFTRVTIKTNSKLKGRNYDLVYY